jgi:hypothetical protein
MKLSSFLIALSISGNLFAFEYKFDCSRGRLRSFDSVDAEDSVECKNYLKLGFAKCFDSAKRNPDSKSLLLHISTPLDGYYSSKESSHYVKARFSEIIRTALVNNVDPYLALAIAMLEAPPTKERESKDFGLIGYSSSYGVIPIDAIGFADFLSCETQAIKGLDLRRLNAPKVKRKIVIDAGAPEVQLCLMDFGSGGAPLMRTNCTTKSTDCCQPAQIKGIDPTKACDSVSDQKRYQILSVAAGSYMRDRFQYGFRVKANEIEDPVQKLAMVAQAYNGYGKFGVTEKYIINKCLNKLDLGKSPVYGAGASDLMLNSLMANSEVREMVSAEMKAAKVSAPVSYLCQAYGKEGSHQISGYAFSDYSQKLLADRRNCPTKSYGLKGTGPRVPNAETTKVLSTE